MLHIAEEPLDMLAEYGRVSIPFEVRSRFRVEASGSGWELIETPVDPPWLKDEPESERPESLPDRMRPDNMTVLAAFEDGRRVGGAILVYDNPDAWFMDGRNDVASCLDLRVETASRRKGVGNALFGAMVQWAAERGCSLLKIETQDTNVPACRFYEAMGCRLGEVRFDAYPGSDEVQLVWHFDLTGGRTSLKACSYVLRPRSDRLATRA